MTPPITPATPLAERVEAARRLLQRHWGFGEFRPAQARVIRSVLAGRDVLAILPTGGGKSLCFQIPALVLGGLTIVVSPLLALMQDQVAALRARGVEAAALNSLLKAPQQAELLQRVVAGTVRLLYVSPERLDRLATDLAKAKIIPALLAIDEAHCLSEWGHDFRPAYRKLGRLRWKLGRPPVVALTGSATPEVRRDIAATLRLGAWGASRGQWDVHLGTFDRPNLWFGVRRVRDEADRWRALLEMVTAGDRTALVYVPTRGLAEGIARTLTSRGIASAPFHAGLPVAVRRETLRRFLEDEVQVVVATCAFGMGIDKPTVRLVVHWNLPPTPESYYQEAGRAGRDGRAAHCVLLYHPADAVIHRRQLDVTFPPAELCQRVWRGEHEAPGGRDPALTRPVLASIERLRRELHPERGPVDWRPVTERRTRARDRLEAMTAYAETRGCRRRALVGYFGERLGSCAGCGACGAPEAPPPPDAAARGRLRDLRRALASAEAPWGGAVLPPEVLVRLAESPPPNGDALATVPGVGQELAARLGQRILHALGVLREEPAAAPTFGEDDAALGAALVEWRAARAAAEAVPPWQVLTDETLRRVAAERPADLATLARVAGLGPRALAAFGEAVLRIVREAAVCPPAA
jgi:ATP-dependent DNA helicase RecQ